MYEVRITPFALEDIWYYTFREWSIEQANLYQSSIEFGFFRLAENPFEGKSIDVIKLGYFKFDIKHHSIM